MEKITNKIKTGVLVLVFSLAYFSTFAQKNDIDKAREERKLQNQNNEVMRKQRCDVTMKKYATYIFEGKLISSKSIGGPYVSNIYEVNEVISCTLKKGTVEIISDKNNWTDDKGNQIFTSDNWQPIYSGTTLNFCTNVEDGIKSSGFANTNAKTLRIQDATAFVGARVWVSTKKSIFYPNINR